MQIAGMISYRHMHIRGSVVGWGRDATVRYWVKLSSAAEGLPDDEALAAGRVLIWAAELLPALTWRPWLGSARRI